MALSLRSIPRFQVFVPSGLALAILAMLLGMGCSSLARRNEYVVKEPPMLYKRAPLHEETDWVHRWRSKAYRTRKPDPASVSPAQRAILKKYGPPSHMRNFRADHGQKVTEWLSLDSDLLVQFVGGQIAYKGPVTDMEKLLIDRGYPNEMMRSMSRLGPERKQYIYWNWLHSKSEIYSFADDYLVESTE